MFFLIDCNNFYASCERVFNPALNGQPVVVLSNNDGCVVARSAEAKQAGIAMGVPYWEVKDIISRHGVQVFSSNYQLYGDLSARIMNIYQQFCPEVEVYSIDEAFLKFEHSEAQLPFLVNLAARIRQAVSQQIGIPVCVGIAPTKTLAKLANHLAKRRGKSGVFSLTDIEKQFGLLSKIDISELWGIGKNLGRSLRSLGIETVWDLKSANQQMIAGNYGVVLLRLVKELNGLPCYGLEPEPEKRRNMVVSRSFRRDVYEKVELEEALAVYCTRLGEKLRQYGQQAGQLSVFLMANPFKNKRADLKRYFSREMTLSIPTSNTNELINNSLQLLGQLYEAGTNYKKAGVMVQELSNVGQLQGNLFEAAEFHAQSTTVNTVMDNINRRYGKNTLYFSTCGTVQDWSRQEQFRSPRYTTNWDELPLVT
jgi:DNA polymerase V